MIRSGGFIRHAGLAKGLHDLVYSDFHGFWPNQRKWVTRLIFAQKFDAVPWVFMDRALFYRMHGQNIQQAASEHKAAAVTNVQD